MKNDNNFKKFLKLLRIKKTLSPFGKILKVDSRLYEKEEAVLSNFLEIFTFTQEDKKIADKLEIDSPEKYKTFIFEENEDTFNYFMQGFTENTSIYIRIKNKDFKYWRQISNLFKNTPFYYFFFKFNIMLDNKTEDTKMMLFGLNIGSIIQKNKIIFENQDDYKKMSSKLNLFFDDSLDMANKTVELFKKETT